MCYTLNWTGAMSSSFMRSSTGAWRSVHELMVRWCTCKLDSSAGSMLSTSRTFLWYVHCARHNGSAIVHITVSLFGLDQFNNRANFVEKICSHQFAFFAMGHIRVRFYWLSVFVHVLLITLAGTRAQILFSFKLVWAYIRLGGLWTYS